MENKKLTNKTLSGIGDLLGKYKKTLKGNDYVSLTITSYSNSKVTYNLYTANKCRIKEFDNKINLIKYLNKELKNGK